MSLQKRAMRGVFWSVTQKWGNQLISTAVFLLLARLLGAKSFGLVALANVYIAFAEIFLEQGLADAIVQRKDIDKEHLDTAFWTSAIIGLFLVAISIIGSDAIAGIFREPEIAPIIRWLSLGIIINSFSGVQTALLRRDLNFKVLAVRTLAGTVISSIVGVVMALMGFGIWSLVAKHLIFMGVGVLLMWGVSDWRPGFSFSRRHFNEMFSFGINVVGFNFFNFFNRRSDDLLIGYFLGSTALGFYSVAYRLLMIMMRLLTGVINTVIFPTFSKIQDDLPRIKNAFYKATKFTSLFAIPCFLGAAAIAPELILVSFGEEWVDSIQVMQALSIGVFIQSLMLLNSNVLLAVGKADWRFKLNILNAVINFTGFLIAVRFGILAIAISFTIRAILVYPAYLFALKKATYINSITYLRKIILPFISSTIMVSSIFITKYFFEINLSNLYLATIYSFIGSIVYISATFFLSPEIVKECRQLFTST